MKYFITICICMHSLCLMGDPGINGHREGADVSERQQNRWIRNSIRELKKFSPEKCQNPIEPRVIELSDYYRKSFRLAGGEGCILFSNGDWIFMVSNSTHDNPRIGDITLAIDSNGRIYKNEGHVCGGIIHFVNNVKMETDTANCFFDHFKSDTDNMGWIRLENN